MIRRLYQTLTGRPWTTTRSCAAEFGPPPGARYADQLSAYSDAELIVHGDRILARLRAQQPTPSARPAARSPACPSPTPPAHTTQQRPTRQRTARPVRSGAGLSGPVVSRPAAAAGGEPS